MAPRASKKQQSDRATPSRGVFVSLTEDIRRLANGVANNFDELSSGKAGFAEQRPGSDDQFVVFVGEILLVVKTNEAFQTIALTHLAELGKVKNEHFPSSQDDLVRRQSEYEKIYQLRHTNHPLWQLYQPVQLGRVRNVKSYVRRQVPIPPTFNEEFLAFPNLLYPMVEGDPLEDPALLLGKNDPESELLIFLEHYLPQDLAEVARNLADPNREYCTLSSKALALVSEFKRCYEAFPVIRTSLLLPDRNVSKYLDDAHDRLLKLTQLILDFSLEALPHKVAIREENKTLVFYVDGEVRNLTPTQQETLVAMAMLQKKSQFSAAAFTKLAGLSQNDEQNVINRCVSLKRGPMPSLAYTFKNGICTLSGLRFEELPSEERLREEF